MIIGFTGTRQGMTNAQKDKVSIILLNFHPIIESLHHGDCIGADAQFHNLCIQAGWTPDEIWLHPAAPPTSRAYCNSNHIMPAKPPLERNHDITEIADRIIACTFGFNEIVRSGTWATIRYARKRGRTIHIIHPDGKMKTEGRR